MNSLIETLRSMSKRPAFYFGHRPATLARLESLFLGIQIGGKMSKDLEVFDAFEEWVLWRHGAPKLSTNSFGYILHHAGGDEEKAFNLFFEYLEEFLLERGKIGAMGIRAGLHSFLSSKIPTVQDIKNDSFYGAYVNTLKKILAEFLGWPEARTLSYMKRRLQNEGFRAWFGSKTPCDDAGWLLIPDSLKKKLAGVPLIRLHERIWEVLEGSGKTYNMFPDTDPRYDWQRAKRKVAKYLKDHESEK